MYCTVLRYWTVLYCAVLYCTVMYCTVLNCTALYCRMARALCANPPVDHGYAEGGDRQQGLP
jgi:hypothetical protein